MGFEIKMSDIGLEDHISGFLLLLIYFLFSIPFTISLCFELNEPFFIIAFLILGSFILIVGILYQIGTPHSNLTYFKTGFTYGLISSLFYVLFSVYGVFWYQSKINMIYLQLCSLQYSDNLIFNSLWSFYTIFGDSYLKSSQGAINGIIVNDFIILFVLCIIIYGYYYMYKHGTSYGFKYSLNIYNPNFKDYYTIAQKEISNKLPLQNDEKTKLCKKCLKPVPIDAKFCIHCGVPM